MKPPLASPHHLARRMVLASGGVQLIVGTVVALGWHLREPALVQLRPGHFPMMYWAAICFIACGFSLWNLAHGRTGIARLAAFLPIIVGALSIFEYTTQISVGIDQLLVKWNGPNAQRYPGRMAPATAVCFVLAGSALFLSCSSFKERWRASAIGGMTAIIVALGTMAIFGYAAGISGAYVWYNLSGMALQTAIAIVVLALGILGSEFMRSGESVFRQQRWLPFGAGLALIVATLVLCQALLGQRRTEILQQSQLRADHLKEELLERLESGSHALRRLANRDAISDGTENATWQAEAEAYLRDEQIFESVARFDRTEQPVWRAFLTPNGVLTDRADVRRPDHRAAIEQAKANGAMTITEVTDLLSGQLGMVLYVSLDQDGEKAGLLAGSMPISRLLAKGAAQIGTTEAFRIKILENGRKVYEALPKGKTIYWEVQAISQLEFLGRSLRIEISPTEAFVRGGENWLPAIVAVLGVLLSFAFASAVRLAQRARQHTKQLRAANGELQREMLERQLSEARFRAIAEVAIDGIVMADADGCVRHWNAAAERICGYTAAEMEGKPLDLILHEKSREGYERMVAGFRQADAGERVGQTIEVIGRRKNGEEFPLEISFGSWKLGAERYFSGILRDITNRKKAEQSLREVNEQLEAHVAQRTTELAAANDQLRSSQSRLQAALFSGGVGTWFWDLDTREVWWDDSVSRLMGLSGASARDYRHEVFQGRVHPDDRAPLNEAMELSVSTGKEFSAEYRVLGADGAYRWLAGKGRFEGASSGTRRMTGACVDINDLKQAFEARRQSEENFRFLADVMPQIIWTAKPDGNLDYFNRRSFDYTGLTHEQAKNWGWKPVLHPDDLESCVQRWTHSFTTGENFETEYRFRRASDNTYRWHLGRAYPQRDTSGKILRWVGTCTDIHDQKVATADLEAQVLERTAELRNSEKVLREKEQFLQSIFTGVDLALAIYDLSPDGRFRVSAVNESFETKLGLSRELVIGRALEDLKEQLPRGLLTYARESFEACLREKQPKEYEVQVTLKGRETWWFRRLTPMTDAQGRVYRVIASSFELTERKQLELALADARDQALEASRLKSEFLATMSHEIRTPMNGIIGMTELLMETSLDPQQREMGRVVQRSAENLLQIINDILDFSKIEAGKMRIESSSFNLREVLEETAAILSPNAHQKKLELICDLDDQLNCALLGDAGRIQQVTTNLLGNAIKFTERGEVDLTAKCIQKTASQVTFQVSLKDTGIGIAKTVKARLFEPFSQGDGSSTRRFGGTGLGLAICRQLIQLMGGELGCESQDGEGSLFWFNLTLPRSELPQAETKAVAMLQNNRVLVVDDNETSCRVLSAQLKAMGAQPTAFREASAVVPELRRAAAAGLPYELVLLDCQMPQWDGIALAKAIRAEERVGGTTLLLLSSTIHDKSADLLASVRIDGTLDKPVRETQLRRTLLRLVGRTTQTPSIFPRKPQRLDRNGLNLLLVEDNVSNQMVATMMLQNQGHRIDLATNGREALAKLAHSHYDAVLMDCQMPEIDGYETTMRIRAGEVPGLNVRIPIIALTAHAMPTDRAKCLEAGMDDYVTKPIDQSAMLAALARCGLNQHKSAAAPAVTPAAPAEAEVYPVIDLTHLSQLQALRKAGGKSVAEEVAALFFQEMPARFQAMSTHIADHRGLELARVAHTLAGSCASLGAKRMRGLAADLEAAAREGAWERASARFDSLKKAEAELQEELTRLELIL